MQTPNHRTAVLQAVFVTFLWSTSWVFIKFGLEDVPAVTFAGLRYVLAFLCLIPFIMRPAYRQVLGNLNRGDWLRLTALGVILYTLAQGAQFLGLVYLPAMTLSLVLNLTALVVALGGIIFLREYPTPVQWVGVALFMAGVVLYFYPVNLPRGEWLGLLIGLVGVGATSVGAVLGRGINRENRIPPILVTAISMGIGSILMLVFGVIFQGLPRLSWTSWGIIIWLAVVNTAYAFALWNNTLRTLSAMESSIINNLMLPQIAILAWIFLGEGLTWQTGLGLILAALGVLLVQLRRDPPLKPQEIAHQQEVDPV